MKATVPSLGPRLSSGDGFFEYENLQDRSRKPSRRSRTEGPWGFLPPEVTTGPRTMASEPMLALSCRGCSGEDKKGPRQQKALFMLNLAHTLYPLSPPGAGDKNLRGLGAGFCLKVSEKRVFPHSLTHTLLSLKH